MTMPTDDTELMTIIEGFTGDSLHENGTYDAFEARLSEYVTRKEREYFESEPNRQAMRTAFGIKEEK